jgi:exodeoxyribonuclease VII small subunit
MGSKKTFEQSLKQLEDIVAELESGDLPLEVALKKFEDGMELSRFCSQKLEETERRVTLLMQDGCGNVVEKPFEPEPEPGDAP